MHASGFGAAHGCLDPSPYNEEGAAYYVSGTPGFAETRTPVMVGALVFREFTEFTCTWTPGRELRTRHGSSACVVSVVSTLSALSLSAKDMLVTRLHA
jgi:hypothetical protein